MRILLPLLFLFPVALEAQSPPFIVVLGIAQDAGYPQVGCEKDCCMPAWRGERDPERVTCLGLVDPATMQSWMFEATPDFPWQFQQLKQESGVSMPSGIFLTHAHIGHYTGLMHLGREAYGASQVPVYAMPKMREFLSTNGPWEQLVTLENIKLAQLEDGVPVELAEGIRVTPFLVPHRDEYSETVGYRIEGPNRSVLFIPDINKWELWEKDLIEELAKVDVALLDATFATANELPGRDMAEIPHPFVEETMELLKDLPLEEKKKVTFIHFNHTNPLLDLGGRESLDVRWEGFEVAWTGLRIKL
ncbi:MAG: MBL fold metallo-hydrolase [Bacteroidota bacterium]